MNLAEELGLTLDLQELGNLVVNTFGEILHLKSVALLLARPPAGEAGTRGDFEIISAFGWKERFLLPAQKQRVKK